jgi:hypothetical protein
MCNFILCGERYIIFTISVLYSKFACALTAVRPGSCVFSYVLLLLCYGSNQIKVYLSSSSSSVSILLLLSAIIVASLAYILGSGCKANFISLYR